LQDVHEVVVPLHEAQFDEQEIQADPLATVPVGQLLAV